MERNPANEMWFPAFLAEARPAIQAGVNAPRRRERLTACSLRTNNAHRDRQLPDMTHRVFGTVHQASDYRRGQLGATDAAKLTECRNIDRPQLCKRRVNSHGQRLKRVRHICGGKEAAFRWDRVELFSGQCLAPGVSNQSVDNAGDVPNMKCGGRDTGGAVIPLLLRQITNHLSDALADLQEDVRNRLENGWNAINGTALPPFSTRHSRVVRNASGSCDKSSSGRSYRREM